MHCSVTRSLSSPTITLSTLSSNIRTYVIPVMQDNKFYTYTKTEKITVLYTET